MKTQQAPHWPGVPTSPPGRTTAANRATVLPLVRNFPSSACQMFSRPTAEAWEGRDSGVQDQALPPRGYLTSLGLCHHPVPVLWSCYQAHTQYTPVMV